MDSAFLRTLKISTIVHFLVVLALIITPAVINRRILKKRREIITFVDFTVALPQPPPAVTPVREIKPPEPPKPKEEPPKSDIPEKPKTPKPKIERSTNRVVRTPPKPAAPPLKPEEIKRLLAAGARISDHTSIPPDLSAASWYYATVRQIMHDAWAQPGASVPAGATAEVEIRVMRDGSVVRRAMVRSSGNAVMDRSVMQAVESVTKLPPLPDAWSSAFRDITVEFVLER